MAVPDPQRAAELAAAHRALADMFEAGAVNVMTHAKTMFIRATDLGPERAAALKAAMQDVDIMVDRTQNPKDSASPWVSHWLGEIGRMEVVIVEGLDDPGTDRNENAQ